MSTHTRARWDKTRIRELFERYQETHSSEIRDELVDAHMNLVEYIAHKFSGRGEPVEDLCQVGLIGLVKAIERFDLQQGAQFSTYATPTVMGEIRRYFRDHGSALKISRSIQELKSSIARAVQEHTARTGQSPTAKAIAESLNVSEERILEAQEAMQSQHVLSLQAENGDAGETLANRMGGDDPGMRHVEDQLTVQEAFRSLTPRERIIIYGRFYKNQSQSDIARMIGVSQMHVCRLERAALKKMRGHLEGLLAA